MHLETLDGNLDRAFKIALAEVEGNIKPYRAGLLETPSPVVMAGAGYNTPWTRDAAINTWNGAGLFWPQAARNTLRSVVEYSDGRLTVAGQYWDAIIWVTGAWSYYCYTGDMPFLEEAFQAASNTMALREQEEFDSERGLFRGPEVYGDGISAYPDRYLNPRNSSRIIDWPAAYPDKKAVKGYGLPMFTLSLNCLYAHTYDVLGSMATALGHPPDPTWAAKAQKLRESISRNFWSQSLGRYIVLLDPWGVDDRQEAIGLAFSVLFGVADTRRAAELFRHVTVTPAGMPVLWPSQARYLDRGGFGRHSGTVWPHAQAFWGDSAAENGRGDLFWNELTSLAGKAVRDGQFYEIYDPVTGLPYGGLQEAGPKGITNWNSSPHQTWSATGYLRLVLLDLIGMKFDGNGVNFAPTVLRSPGTISLTGLEYRAATLDIRIRGTGSRIAVFSVNGRATSPRISASAQGRQKVDIELAQ